MIMHKLARPKMRGAPIQIRSGTPMLLTEKGKHRDIPNQMVNDILGGLMQFKGELVVGRPEAEDCFDVSMKFITDPHMIHLWVLWVYDLRTVNFYALKDRLEMAQSFVNTCGPNVQFVDHELIESQQALMEYKDKVVERGFPGIILREPYGTFGTYDEEITAETAIA